MWLSNSYLTQPSFIGSYEAMHLPALSKIAEHLHTLPKIQFHQLACLLTRKPPTSPSSIKAKPAPFLMHNSCWIFSKKPSLFTTTLTELHLLYIISISVSLGPVGPIICVTHFTVTNEAYVFSCVMPAQLNVSSLKSKIMTHDFFIATIALNSEFCTW